MLMRLIISIGIINRFVLWFLHIFPKLLAALYWQPPGAEQYSLENWINGETYFLMCKSTQNAHKYDSLGN